jgi:hypothetical protein
VRTTAGFPPQVAADETTAIPLGNLPQEPADERFVSSALTVWKVVARESKSAKTGIPFFITEPLTEIT